MSNLTKVEQGFLAAPNGVYEQLLSHTFFQTYISHSTLSLTLVNNMIRTIASTRNTKFRRKHILTLCTYLHTQTKSVHYYAKDVTVNKFVYVVYSLLLQLTLSHQIANYPDKVTVRVLSIENSPWYTAVQIGDSKHYQSCLRSGVLTDDSVNPTTVTEEEWTTAVNDGGFEDGDVGCNFEYIYAEVKAFKEGRLVYVGIGTLPHEGGSGFISRARVHVLPNTDTGESVCVIDRVYGQDEYLLLFVNKLRERFDKVCSNTYALGDRVTFDEDTRVLSVFKSQRVYSDYTFGTIEEIRQVPLQSAFTQNHSGRYIGRLADNTMLYCSKDALRSLCTPYTPTIHPTYYINTGLEECVTGKLVASVVVYLCKKYNKPVKVVNKEITCSWIGGGKLFTSDFSNKIARWTFRNYDYKLTLSYHYSVGHTISLTRTSVDSTRLYTYNVRTGRWVSRSFMDSIAIQPEYHINRYTYHVLDQFLPKNARHFITHG